MAKRELIEKEYVEDVLSDTINSEGDYRHALRLLNGATITTEQDIVKPYLDRLKRKMEARDDDNGGEPLNAVDRGYHLAYEHLCEEIDNLLSESEGASEL